MIVQGQLPDGVPSLLVTVRLPVPQASVIVNPLPVKYAKVLVAVGASDAEQPSWLMAVKMPLIVGAMVSSTVMVCCAVLLLPQASVTV